MKNRKITLRMAVPDDAKALVAVYAPYVLHTAVTYEYEVPSVEEFRSRIEHTLENYPYVVAEVDGEIAGYAYTGRLGVRAAFAWAAETSIYLREDCHGLGIGTMPVSYTHLDVYKRQVKMTGSMSISGIRIICTVIWLYWIWIRMRLSA